MSISKLTFHDIEVGMSASFTKQITEEDVTEFARLSGDTNPLHVDDSYAASTPFKIRVVHGMYLGALVSQLIGLHLPGQEGLLVSMSLDFKKPVFIGDTVTVSGIVMRKSEATKLIDISVQVQKVGTIVAEGEVRSQVRS